ncbi:NAD(P)/FAD-dependent oxidoreductase [Pontibacter anaerobius]|uniref:FAD/NAD(P)-binding oxidoreductase n=1 Tax=Pontibacter anaerobius TaxID=2993940 RepID=A0ABT3RAZ5_9BACT|nr:FAD/NAD(P)-binding oxidoreductase [Pontibacter anaerobius]MCX2739028.1 FAD/NAD(P)-binding oxidoreductase [Pontibacter anaerobius]
MYTHYQVLVIGGGTAGIMLSAKLHREQKHLRIAIIEPSQSHWYQPAWTLVGAGTFDYVDTRREEASVIPEGVDWIQDKAVDILPDEHMVRTETSGEYTYDYLVVAPGAKYDLEAIEGLAEAMQQPNVCSNYIDPRKTWNVLLNFKGGNAVFTQPTTPIKCGGAPQKIMYLADDYFRKTGVRDKSEVIFATPGSTVFGVKEFLATLQGVIERKDIIVRTFYAPIKIDGERSEIHYKRTQPDAPPFTPDEKLHEREEGPDTVVIPYGMLHLAPPHVAPDVIRNNPKLAVTEEGGNKGWLDVDIHTLQHKRYPNIYGLGDIAALPTAKTGAAVRKQAPVVAAHLLAQINQEKQPELQYGGYSSCPFITGYGKMVLAEFKYDNLRDSDPLISKFVDTTKEQWSMWLLKKYGLPWMYWNLMLKGIM